MGEVSGSMKLGNDELAYLLEEPERGMLAVSLHGGGPSDMRNIEYLMPIFRSLSIGMLRFDFPGHGASPGLKSESSLQKRLEQARFAIDSLGGKAELCLVGTSMGGYIASCLVPEYPVRKLVLFCPAAYDAAARRLPFDENFSRAIRREKSYLDSDVGSLLGGFRGEALLVSGDADEVVPEEVFGLYERALSGCASCKRVVLAGAPHPLHVHALKDAEARGKIEGELRSFLADR